MCVYVQSLEAKGSAVMAKNESNIQRVTEKLLVTVLFRVAS